MCTLSAINWGLINDPKDFEKYCDLAVRSLDALLDYQDILKIERKNDLFFVNELGFELTDSFVYVTVNHYFGLVLLSFKVERKLSFHIFFCY